MNKKIFEGTICLDYKSITYYVCDLSYTVYENDSFEYRFLPNYFVMDLLDSSIFQGIPGLNLDERNSEYIRKNIIPTFISERVPQKNREDLYQLLEEVGLDYLNPIEYLLRTKKRYGGDPLYLKSKNNKKTVILDELKGTYNSFDIIKLLLDNLAMGNNVIYQSTLIDNTNRKSFFNVFLGIYYKMLSSRKDAQNEGIQLAKASDKYKGRKPIYVDMIFFNDLLEQVKNKNARTGVFYLPAFFFKLDSYIMYAIPLLAIVWLMHC